MSSSVKAVLAHPKARAGIVALILGGCLVVSFLLDPDYDPGFTLCAYKNATGRPCLGCGLTHAFVWLSHGRWREAVAANPLVLVLYPGFAAGLAWALARLAGRVGPVPYPKLPEWVYGVLVSVLILAWAARSLSLW